VPTYQYTCRECGEQVEVVQKFTDDALTVCPACGGVLRKVFSPVGIVFKGSGFYRNDSRKGSSSDIPAAKDKEPSGAKSADSKPGASKDSGSSSSSSDSSSSSSGSGSSGSSGSSESGSSGSGSSDSSSSASSGKNGSKSSAPAASA
jgi:putative FmdB family regulatory protein